MRIVNIVSNGVVTNANVVAQDDSLYIKGTTYVPCLIRGHWVNVRSDKVVDAKTAHLPTTFRMLALTV
ncbi:hypothetical protein [Vibrio phage JSF23]|jgi:hypothetical protein|uniref:Uncharacterized protein n=3 Tax=Icepovirus bengalense TaxID=2846603 RepID=A0A076GB75_9CAUD|nr:hypothetical protein ViPhICP2p30 [Vibrio phage ICP2]ADX87712.1 hypothetical protein [Vibrio phage ICP2]AII27074.1 hypothetical protein ICP22011A_0030 [Vibrio phage ICP2_2011_A]ASV43727.1 hypothetical protein [Vibrio phage JSF23]ASV43823.1 hypothetical protein [Vibrio phage JSF27]